MIKIRKLKKSDIGSCCALIVKVFKKYNASLYATPFYQAMGYKKQRE